MYSPTLHMRLASLAASLPAGSPARRSLMAHLKIANAQFNLFTRLCILLGAAGHPFTEVARASREGARGIVSRIQSLQAELPKLDPEWFDSRNVYTPDFYSVMYGAAMRRVRDPEKAMELVSAATAGSSDAAGNLPYQLGRSRKERGLTDLKAAANALAKNISMRGLDVLRQETTQSSRDIPFDPTGGEEDDGKSFAESLTQSGEMGLFDLILNSSEGRKVLNIIDQELNFAGSPKQEAAWESIKANPALLNSNEELAKAIANYLREKREKEGKPPSADERQSTSQAASAAKHLVLRQVKNVAENSPAVERELSMISELSRLRRASAKKKRLASLLRAADTIKHAYDKGMLDDALKLLKDADTTLHDLANVLDARVGGEGSVADTFNTAADLSKWLRGNMSKEFDAHDKAFRAQVKRTK